MSLAFWKAYFEELRRHRGVIVETVHDIDRDRASAFSSAILRETSKSDTEFASTTPLD